LTGQDAFKRRGLFLASQIHWESGNFLVAGGESLGDSGSSFMTSFPHAMIYEIKKTGFSAQSKGQSRRGRHSHPAARDPAA
jgi:hypothetical protein